MMKTYEQDYAWDFQKDETGQHVYLPNVFSRKGYVMANDEVLQKLLRLLRNKRWMMLLLVGVMVLLFFSKVDDNSDVSTMYFCLFVGSMFGVWIFLNVVYGLKLKKLGQLLIVNERYTYLQRIRNLAKVQGVIWRHLMAAVVLAGGGAFMLLVFAKDNNYLVGVVMAVVATSLAIYYCFVTVQLWVYRRKYGVADALGGNNSICDGKDDVDQGTKK